MLRADLQLMDNLLHGGLKSAPALPRVVDPAHDFNPLFLRLKTAVQQGDDDMQLKGPRKRSTFA